MRRMTSVRSLCTTAIVTLILSVPARAQSFDAFAKAVSAMPPDIRVAMVDSLVGSYPTSPVYRDDTIAVFYYRGEATAVAVAGDVNGWNPHADHMTNIAGTDLWYLTRTFERDTRLDYKFVVDSTDWILDPRNDRTSRSGFGMNSELRMPGVPSHPERLRRSDVAGGSIVDTAIASLGPGSERTVRIYAPKIVRATDSVGLLLVHDGLEFLGIAGMDVVLDNLIADGSIPPVIAVFVPPVERTREYSGDLLQPFSSYLVHDLVPALRRRYSMSHDPAHSVVMGASNGGNISLFMGMTYPHIFGNVAAFSSNVIPVIQARFSSTDILPLRVYLDIGKYDIPQLVPRVQTLRNTLQANGYSFLYAEHNDGHSWTSWSAHIDDALLFLLAAPENR